MEGRCQWLENTAIHVILCILIAGAPSQCKLGNIAMTDDPADLIGIPTNLLFSNLLHSFTNLLPKFWSTKLSSRVTTFPSSCIPSRFPCFDGSFRYLIRFTGLCVSICSSGCFPPFLLLGQHFTNSLFDAHSTSLLMSSGPYMSLTHSTGTINSSVFLIPLCPHYCPLVGFAGLFFHFAFPLVVRHFLPLCLFNKFPSIKLSLAYVVWNMSFFLPLSSCIFWLWILFFHM